MEMPNDFLARPGSSIPSMRRAVTLPLRPSRSNNDLRESPASGLEAFYVHPSVRIVAFESFTPTRYSSRRDQNRLGAEEEAGTLPYSSAFERTIAVGAMRMYRTHDEFAILNCGKCIQPIMPKSRSWCVDDEGSKFVLQIRRPLFWRIELPAGDSDHAKKSAELKVVLSQISQFEKTACPFSRTFQVELPELPKEPAKKKPWKPAPRPQTAPNGSVSTPRPTEVPDRNRDLSPVLTRERSVSHAPTVPKRVGSIKNRDSYRAFESQSPVPPLPTSSFYTRHSSISSIPVNELEKLRSQRSVTAPHLAILGNLSRKSSKQSLGEDSVSQSEGLRSSDGSFEDPFHSTQNDGPIMSPPTRPRGPSPRLPTVEDIRLPKRNDRSQNLTKSELENLLEQAKEAPKDESPQTPRTPRVWKMLDGVEDGSSNGSGDDTLASSPPPALLTPALKAKPILTPPDHGDSSSDEEYFDTSAEPTPVPSPGFFLPRPPTHRRQRSMSDGYVFSFDGTSDQRGRRPSISLTERSALHRALSPLPSAANLFTPTRPDQRLMSARQLPTAIAQKTWEILMSPPSHLISMILQVAAKVALRLRGGRTWDGETDVDTEVEWSEDEEDDFGMPVACVRTWSRSNLNREEVEVVELETTPKAGLLRVTSRDLWKMPGAFGDSSDLD